MKILPSTNFFKFLSSTLVIYHINLLCPQTHFWRRKPAHRLNLVWFYKATLY